MKHLRRMLTCFVSAGAITSTVAAQALIREFIGPYARAHLGYRVASAGDVNADGTPDILIPAEGSSPVLADGFVTVRSGATGAPLYFVSGGLTNSAWQSRGSET